MSTSWRVPSLYPTNMGTHDLEPAGRPEQNARNIPAACLLPTWPPRASPEFRAKVREQGCQGESGHIGRIGRDTSPQPCRVGPTSANYGRHWPMFTSTSANAGPHLSQICKNGEIHQARQTQTKAQGKRQTRRTDIPTKPWVNREEPFLFVDLATGTAWHRSSAWCAEIPVRNLRSLATPIS